MSRHVTKKFFIKKLGILILTKYFTSSKYINRHRWVEWSNTDRSNSTILRPIKRGQIVPVMLLHFYLDPKRTERFCQIETGIKDPTKTASNPYLLLTRQQIWNRVWIRIGFGIRIRIQEGKMTHKNRIKVIKFHVLQVLDVLFWGLKASSVALKDQEYVKCNFISKNIKFFFPLNFFFNFWS
jgi:hypothetical protein